MATPSEDQLFNAFYFHRVRSLHHVSRRVLGYIEDAELTEIKTSPSPAYGVTLSIGQLAKRLGVTPGEVEFAFIELRKAGLITENGRCSVSAAEARVSLENLVRDLVGVLAREQSEVALVSA